MQKILIITAIVFCLITIGCQSPKPVSNPMSATANVDRLWFACKDELTARGFVIGFQNRTAGIIETRPLVSKQWFELWKNDVVDSGDVLKSSLQTTRRTVRLNINWSQKPNRIECLATVEKLYIVPESKSDSVKTDDVYIASSRLLRKKSQKGSQVWDPQGRDNQLEQAILQNIKSSLSLK